MPVVLILSMFCIGLARIIYFNIVIYMVYIRHFWQELTKYTVIYSTYIQF